MGEYPNFINRSPSGLVDALCSRIEKVLRSYWQKGEFPDEEYHTPYIHAQYLPVSKTESGERDKSKDCPYVHVVCTSGTISDFHPSGNGSEINIQIYFTGYRNDPDNQGWRIPEMMLWYILQDLCGEKIVNGYWLETPVKWTVLNSREPPYYTAMMETKWKGSPPAIEAPSEGTAIYGEDAVEKFGS